MASSVSVREPIWLTFTRIELAVPVSMPFCRNSHVGDEEIVADELHLVAQGVGQLLPAVPVVLGAAVLDGDDRVLGDEVLVVGDDFIARCATEPSDLLEDVVAVLLLVVELGGGATSRAMKMSLPNL